MKFRSLNFNSVSFYTITAYTQTFGKDILKLTQSDSLLVTLCVGLANLFWLPLMGSLSDRVGRRPLLIAFAALAILTAEIVPAAVRTAGFSVAYSLATTIGGSTPAIVTYLIHETGNRAMPGAWMSLAAGVALMPIWMSRPQKTH